MQTSRSTVNEIAQEEYVAINKANWDERAPAHAAAPSYCYQRLLREPDFISDVVLFDIPLIGDISGLDIVHLQCHIGTDTLSLARRGAKSVTGLDFSAPALKECRDLAAKAAGGDKLSFVEATTYDALKVLKAGSFDLVFTGIGALPWLPDIKLWAQTVAGLLKPGGRLFIREGHPIMFALDDEVKTAPTIAYPYFETKSPEVFEGAGTYVDVGGKEFSATKTVVWNHGLGETINALLEAGMQITGLTEHKQIPWNAVAGQMKRVVEVPDLRDGNEYDRWSGVGEWEMKKGKDNLPLSFTLQAVKKH